MANQKTEKTEAWRINNYVKSMQAMLDGRADRIRELEKQIDSLTAAYGGQLAAAQGDAHRYEAWWRNEREEVLKLKNTIKAITEKLALVDGTADRNRAEVAEAALRVKNGMVRDLAERVAYLQGHIDSTFGKKPAFDRAMTGPETDMCAGAPDAKAMLWNRPIVRQVPDQEGQEL